MRDRQEQAVLLDDCLPVLCQCRHGDQWRHGDLQCRHTCTAVFVRPEWRHDDDPGGGDRRAEYDVRHEAVLYQHSNRERHQHRHKLEPLINREDDLVRI